MVFTASVLAVQGTADPYGTVLHVEAVRDGTSGPVELLVLDCGHAPHLEAPDEVMTGERLSDLYGTEVDVLRVRGRVVVVGTPDDQHVHHLDHDH